MIYFAARLYCLGFRVKFTGLRAAGCHAKCLEFRLQAARASTEWPRPSGCFRWILNLQLRPEQNLCSHPRHPIPPPSSDSGVANGAASSVGRASSRAVVNPTFPLRPGSWGHSPHQIPLLTELETLFDFGCYNYAAPDGAETESQRDSNPSAQGWHPRRQARSAYPGRPSPQIHQR